MGYCYEKGLPHSEFLEWEPTDRAKVIAWRIEESGTCQMCGTASWQWDADQFAFEPQEVWCKGCYIKDVSDESDRQTRLPGTSIRLIPRAEAERLAREEHSGAGRTQRPG